MDPAKISLHTAIQNYLYQPGSRLRSSPAVQKTRELLKDVIDIAPHMLERISSYEQAAESLLEAKKQAGGLNRAGAAERLGSIKEKLKLLKLFSHLGDKKIAREAARLAGEINRTLGLYKSMLQAAGEEDPAEETAEGQDEGQSPESASGGSSDISPAEESAQSPDAGKAPTSATAGEEEAIVRDAEDALKIAREIVEEYIRMHPRDRDNRDLRRQIEEAAYTIAMMKLDSITAALRPVVAAD